MTELDTINEAVEFIFGNRTLKIKQLSTLRRRAIMQSWLIAQLIAEIRDKGAALYEGQEDRDRYIGRCVEALPSGQELQDRIDTLKLSYDIILRWLEASTGKSRDALEVVLNDATVEEIRTVTLWLVGKKKHKS